MLNEFNVTVMHKVPFDWKLSGYLTINIGLEFVLQVVSVLRLNRVSK